MLASLSLETHPTIGIMGRGRTGTLRNVGVVYMFNRNLHYG